jgi:transposase
MIPDQVEVVIGVDTHLQTHTAAVVAVATGVQLGEAVTITTDPAGYTRLMDLIAVHAPDPARRAWAIEGTGSYGKGLTSHLQASGEWVGELDRATRAARTAPGQHRRAGKSDHLDALRAAKDALSRTHLARPKTGAERDALQILTTVRAAAVTATTDAINQLRALILTAAEPVRAQLGPQPARRKIPALLATIPTLTPTPGQITEHVAVTALQSLANRIRHLRAETTSLERQMRAIITAWRPDLLAVFGVGTIVAATVLTAWSHPGRCRNDAAFAALAGTNPLPASSGKTVRHRLNRGGNRALNAALHVTIVTRMRHDPTTRAYIERRRAQNKTDREIRRCLKRYLARQLYRLLENPSPGT